MPAPVSGPITQGFGPTDEPLDGPYNGAPHFNKGYDYGVPSGTTARATVGGTVIAVGDQGDGWGVSTKIRDAQGNVHNYGHLSSNAGLEVGQQVAAGDAAGVTGNTGHSTGPHLSYDVMDKDGRFIDPTPFVDGGSVGAQLTSDRSPTLSADNPGYTPQSATGSGTASDTGQPSDVALQMAKIQATINEKMGLEPQRNDPMFQLKNADGSVDFDLKTYSTLHDAWNQTLTQLDNQLKAYTSIASLKDQADASRIAHQNADTSSRNADISQQNADTSSATQQNTALHNANSDALTKSGQDINAFYLGRTDSRDRAAEILKGQQELIKYGVPTAGPQDFSYGQLFGKGGFWGKQAGGDNNAAYHVLGTTYIDPAGTMNANDNLLGVNRGAPSSANLLTGDSSSGGMGGGYRPSATPSAVSLQGAIAGMNKPTNLLTGTGTSNFPRTAQGTATGFNPRDPWSWDQRPEAAANALPSGYGATSGLGDASSPSNGNLLNGRAETSAGISGQPTVPPPNNGSLWQDQYGTWWSG